MKYNKVSRRFFLQGAGNAFLALPILPSLLERSVLAADAVSNRPRFIFMANGHGNLFGSNLYPYNNYNPYSTSNPMPQANGAPAFQTLTPDFGHQMRHGNLVSLKTNGRVSPTIGSDFSDAILGKMNFLRGLDIMYYLGHHTGGHLGNGFLSDGNGNFGPYILPRVTMDQLLAHSTSQNRYYAVGEPITMKSVNTGSGQSLSSTYQFPSIESGEIVTNNKIDDPGTLFRRIFGEAVSQKQTIVDLVLPDFMSLRSGAYGLAARLGAQDRQKIDEHMESLFEVQRRLRVQAQGCAFTTYSTAPTTLQGRADSNPNRSNNDPAAYYGVINDILVAAFRCGYTRIATISLGEDFFNYSGDAHQGVYHQGASQQPLILERSQKIARDVFLNLIQKMNAISENGGTMLDNSVVIWSQEATEETHNQWGMPIVMAGSAGGRFTTGRYIDYRDLSNRSLTNSGETGEVSQGRRPGIPYNRFLGTLLRAMGMQRGVDYQCKTLSDSSTLIDVAGYGDAYRNWPNAHPQRILNHIGDPLPVLWNG